MTATKHDRDTGGDLLADVFEGTEDAPCPMARRDAGGNLLWLWPALDDPRWDVKATFYPDGKLMRVDSVTRRGAA